MSADVDRRCSTRWIRQLVDRIMAQE
jgi:hypothetical protein